MIDLKHEIERELSVIHPPDLWDRIQADASNNDDAAVLDLTIAWHRRRSLLWLAAVAAVAVLALVVALTSLEDQPVDTVQADRAAETTTTTSEEPVWPGPVRDPSDVVHVLDAQAGQDTWDDPLDASERWADVDGLSFSRTNYGHWSFHLAANPPPLEVIEPGVVIAYGLVFDTNADGAADYVVGIDNDAPRQGDFRAWITDLGTGETEEQVGPPYGSPIEFAYAVGEGEAQPGGDEHSLVILTFLLGSAPADLDLDTMRFYAWTSATRDGLVFAHDYAPDTGWLSVE